MCFKKRFYKSEKKLIFFTNVVNKKFMNILELYNQLCCCCQSEDHERSFRVGYFCKIKEKAKCSYKLIE